MLVTLRDQRVNFVKLLLMHVRKESFIYRMTYKKIVLSTKQRRASCEGLSPTQLQFHCQIIFYQLSYIKVVGDPGHWIWSKFMTRKMLCFDCLYYKTKCTVKALSIITPLENAVYKYIMATFTGFQIQVHLYFILKCYQSK